MNVPPATPAPPVTESAGAAVLRRCLLGLGAIGGAGAAADLTIAPHWQSPIQLLPWFAVAAMLAAVILLGLRPSSAGIRVTRVVAVLAGAAGAFGAYRHTAANHAAGVLNFRYADTWGQRSGLSQWWAAATGGVGPAPPLAPGVLAFAAAALLAATLHHPERQRL